MAIEPIKPDESKEILEIYKLMVEMADRVSQRRQSANSFYLTVNTAIVGGTTYFSQSSFTVLNTWAVSIAGIAICILWIRAVVSYKSLNSAKFAIITALEVQLPVSAYNDEWKILDPDGDGKRHTPFHKTEVLVPVVFMVVHFAQALMLLPVQRVILCLVSEG